MVASATRPDPPKTPETTSGTRLVTLPPRMFDHPLLSNVLTFDHVQLQQWSDCWGFWAVCRSFERLPNFTGAAV